MRSTIPWLVIVVTVFLTRYDAVPIPNRWPFSRLNQFITRNASHQEPSVPGVCNSSLCQQDAKEILESLDKSVDPCEDFYQFACGGWKETHPATKVTPVFDHYSEIPTNVMAQVETTLEEPTSEDDISPLNTAKKMYQVCMDVDTIERAGIQPLVELSNEVGWPMALEDWTEEEFSLETVLAEYDRRLFRSPFFHSHVDTYHANTSRLYVHIKGPQIGLSRSELLDPWEVGTRDEYKQLIANVSLEILNATGVNLEEEVVLQHATEIVDFMIQLQNISLELSENGENATLQELQFLTNFALSEHNYLQFEWLTYFNKILSDTDIVLDENEEVIVYNQMYLFELFKLLSNTTRRIIANYLHWRIINTVKDATTKRMQELTLHYKNETRSTYCSRKIMSRFNHVLNSRIVPNLLNAEVEDNFRSLVERFRSEFENQIASVEWLDDDARAVFIEVVRSLNTNIGYPKHLYDNASALEELYKKVNVSDDHFNNMLILTSNFNIKSITRLRDNFSLIEYIWLKMKPEKPNALYMFSENAVFFTFGLLQHHFLNHDRLKSLSYGRIGNTVGHEMMHSITATYMTNDWGNRMSDDVDEKHQCFIDQYNNYHFTELEELTNMNVTVNGAETLIENLADASGVYTAYKAYQTHMEHSPVEPSLPGLEEFSPDQMFFIGYGTAECESRTSESMEQYLKATHAPMFARVQGTVSNMDPFATAFNCPAGSNMNPVNKCRMW